MAQLQNADGHQFTRRAGATEPSQREVKQVGDALCITHDAAAEGGLQVCLHAVRSETQQVIAAEEWPIGATAYWHDYLNGGEGRISRLESDAPVGYAVAPYTDGVTSTNLAKDAGDLSSWINVTTERRGKHMVVVLDFAGADTPKAVGSYTLRVFSTEPGGNAQIHSATFSHDGNLAPSTTVIELGTLADADVLTTALDFATIDAGADPYEPQAIALAGAAAVVECPEVVLTITVAPATAGKLKIVLSNNSF